MTEQTVTKDMLTDVRRLARRSSLDVSFIGRWNRESGIYSIETCERIDNGEGAEPRHAERRTNYPCEGTQEVYESTNGEHSDLYANPFTTRALVGIANVAKVGDVIRLRFVVGNTSEMMKEHGVTEDVCTIEVQRTGADGRRRLVAELAFDVRVSEAGNRYQGMRGYYTPTYRLTSAD